MNHIISEELLEEFGRYLRCAEKSEGTIANYLRHGRQFSAFSAGRPVTRELLLSWKESLISQNYSPATVNAMMVSINRYLKWQGLEAMALKTLKVQRRIFRESRRELSHREYQALVNTARGGADPCLALIMETICGTGIRVGELRFITAEAVAREQAVIRHKGKVRTILLPGKLCRKLREYLQKQKILSGEVFLTEKGKSINRRQIWARMKRLCGKADVAPSKVFPHNLRHLFATAFYESCKDIIRLADVLGHSNVETTRLYLMSSGQEHRALLERLRLVL